MPKLPQQHQINTIFKKNRVDYYKTAYYNNYIILLNELGIENSDITPFVDRSRSLEIKEYIKKYNITNYVIVDDELISDKELQQHQVLLDLYLGLQSYHVEPIIKILNGHLGLYPSDYNINETSEEQYIRINEYHKKLSKSQNK